MAVSSIHDRKTGIMCSRNSSSCCSSRSSRSRSSSDTSSRSRRISDQGGSGSRRC